MTHNAENDARLERVRELHSGHHWCADAEGRADFFMVNGETGSPWPCPTLEALRASDAASVMQAEAWERGHFYCAAEQGDKRCVNPYARPTPPGVTE